LSSDGYDARSGNGQGEFITVGLIQISPKAVHPMNLGKTVSAPCMHRTTDIKEIDHEHSLDWNFQSPGADMREEEKLIADEAKESRPQGNVSVVRVIPFLIYPPYIPDLVQDASAGLMYRARSGILTTEEGQTLSSAKMPNK